MVKSHRFGFAPYSTLVEALHVVERPVGVFCRHSTTTWLLNQMQSIHKGPAYVLIIVDVDLDTVKLTQLTMTLTLQCTSVVWCTCSYLRKCVLYRVCNLVHDELILFIDHSERLDYLSKPSKQSEQPREYSEVDRNNHNEAGRTRSGV